MGVPSEIMQAVEGMKPLSQSALQLLDLSVDNEHSVRDVVRIIETDAVIAAAVLRAANSAAVASRDPVESLQRAVVLLGERMVVGIALNSAGGPLYREPLEGYEALRGQLGAHSLRTAIASRGVARLALPGVAKQGEELPDIAYVGGLLHDIGKAVLAHYFHGIGRTVLVELEHHQLDDFLAGEREHLGTDHCEVGQLVARHWELPEAISACISYHHHPGKAEEDMRPLLYAIHLGDTIAMMVGSGTGVDTLQYKLDSNYSQYLRVRRRDLEKILMDVEFEYKKVQPGFESGSG